MTDIDWRLGACFGHSEMQQLFFADTKDRRKVNAAKAVCHSCSIRLPCHDYAFANGEEGIWGGTTEEERNTFTGILRPLLLASGGLSLAQASTSSPYNTSDAPTHLANEYQLCLEHILDRPTHNQPVYNSVVDVRSWTLSWPQSLLSGQAI